MSPRTTKCRVDHFLFSILLLTASIISLWETTLSMLSSPKAMTMLPTTHKKKNKNNNRTTQDWKPILNLPRSTFQPAEQMMKPRDLSYNLKRNFLNKLLTKIDAKGHNNESHKINSPQQKMRNDDNLAVVPTNKTNSFRTLFKSNYCK